MVAIGVIADNGSFWPAKDCPLMTLSGQRWILARDGLSAYDPTATFAERNSCTAVGPMQLPCCTAKVSWKETRHPLAAPLIKVNLALELTVVNLKAAYPSFKYRVAYHPLE